MPPYAKQYAHAAVAGTTGAVSPSWPTHKAGDIGILVVGANFGGTGTQNSIALTDAQGFAQVGSLVQNVGNGAQLAGSQLGVYWCRATSNAMPAPSVQANNDNIIAKIITFGDVIASGNPFNGSPAQDGTVTAGNTSHSLIGSTTTIDDCLAVMLAATSADTAAIGATGWDNSDLDDVHEVLDNSSTLAGGAGIMGAVGVKETAGSFGTTAVTTSISQVIAMMSFSLLPLEPDPGDTAAPTITLISPENGEIYRNTPIVVDVEDETGISLAILQATYPSGRWDVVHDHFRFGEHFQGETNVREVLDGGLRYRYTLLRDGGWRERPKIEFAVRDGGNAAEVVEL